MGTFSDGRLGQVSAKAGFTVFSIIKTSGVNVGRNLLPTQRGDNDAYLHPIFPSHHFMSFFYSESRGLEESNEDQLKTEADELERTYDKNQNHVFEPNEIAEWVAPADHDLVSGETHHLIHTADDDGVSSFL